MWQGRHSGESRNPEQATSDFYQEIVMHPKRHFSLPSRIRYCHLIEGLVNPQLEATSRKEAMGEKDERRDGQRPWLLSLMRTLPYTESLLPC